MPVNKLMLTMGIPMILSMMLQALYNIVDSAFVSNIPDTGELALNALTLAFPIQMLMVAVAIGTGVGANALLAKTLGQGNHKKAGRVAGNALFLGAVIYVFFLLFGILGVEAYTRTQTKNPQIIKMTVDYLRICCMVSPGILFFSMYEKLLQATGRSLFSTIAQITGALTNIILDPLLIYGMFGLPAMGVRGAITPIISFNHGMHNKNRIESGIRCGILYTLGIMLAGLLVLEIFAKPFSGIFGLSGSTEQLCIRAMQIISLSFLFAGANIAFQGIFQALDGGLESLIISVCRQFLFVLPVAFGFSLIARQTPSLTWLVWLTFIIAEGISSAIALSFMHRIRKNVIQKL